MLWRAHVMIIVGTLISSTSGRYIILNPYRELVIFWNGTTDVYTTVTHFAILLELQVPSYARQRRRSSSYRGYQVNVFSRIAARDARGSISTWRQKRQPRHDLACYWLAVEQSSCNQSLRTALTVLHAAHVRIHMMRARIARICM